MARVKEPHLAIDASRKVGLPLKLAGEIQPIFKGCRTDAEERFSAASMAADDETRHRACVDAPALTGSAGASALDM